MDEPDYNKDNPRSLLQCGLRRGMAINLDPRTIVPLSSNHGVYVGKLRVPLTDDARRGGYADRVVIKKVEASVTRVPRDVEHEISLLGRREHPHILALLNAYLQPPTPSSPIATYLIFTPYYPFTLRDVLDSQALLPTSNAPGAPLKVIHSLAAQLVCAVTFLRENGTAHRDINPSNCVISARGRLVLIDFGISVDDGVEAPGQMHFEVGTQPYRAPELVFASRDYDVLAVDLWALGATLAEFFTNFMQPRASAESPPSSSSEDESDCFSEPDSAVATAKPRRRTLFDGSATDFALVGSMFKLLGTPTEDTWPEAASLPSFRYFSFKDFSPQPLASSLPYLPQGEQCSPLADVIAKLLVFSAKERRLEEKWAYVEEWAGYTVVLPDDLADNSDIEETEDSRMLASILATVS